MPLPILEFLEPRRLLTITLDANEYEKALKFDTLSWNDCGTATQVDYETFISFIFDPEKNGKIGSNNTQWKACIAFFKTYSDFAESSKLSGIAEQQKAVQAQFNDQEALSTDHANCANSSAELAGALPNLNAITAAALTLSNYPCLGLNTDDVNTKNDIFRIVRTQNNAFSNEDALTN